MSDLLIVAISLTTGFFAGILSGLLGIGGGIIFVPVLYYLLPYTGIPENLVSITAVATSLFAGCFSSGSSAVNHFLSKNVDFKKVILISSGSITSAIFVPRFALNLDPKLLSYILVTTLTLIFIRFVFISNRKNINIKVIADKYFYPFGVFVGAISSLCGIGGGGIVVPFLTNFSKIGMKKIIGTSSIITAITMFGSVIVYWFAGSSENTENVIAFAVGLPLGAGAMFGARIGVKGTNKFSDILLKKIFSVFLLVVIISLLLKL